MMLTTQEDTRRMSHRHDPDTSRDAAVKASRGDKKQRLYWAITRILETQGPLTPREVHAVYEVIYAGKFPDADLYDIRRRMSELQHKFDRIEPVGRRDGERVMRLVGGAW